MLDKTTKRRLMKLIEGMESLPKSADNHFNMGAWFRHVGKQDHGLRDGDYVKREHIHACGTTACALGWAATMPYFRKLGLKVVVGMFLNETIGQVFFLGERVFSDNTADSGFLNLTEDQAEDLFGCHNEDRSPKAWAKRARWLIKQWETEA